MSLSLLLLPASVTCFWKGSTGQPVKYDTDVYQVDKCYQSPGVNRLREPVWWSHTCSVYGVCSTSKGYR